MLIGNIIKDETSIALYKVSNILPFSILILPIVFIKTDFVSIQAGGVHENDFTAHD